MKSILLVVSLIGTVFLTACSGSPNDDDVKKAVENNVNQKNDNNIHLFGSQNANLATIKLLDVKKLGDCVKQSDGKDYVCDLQVTVESQIMGKKTSNNKVTFTKDNDNNWVILEPNS